MWLTMKRATDYYGYAHPESLRNRIRQLRDGGLVSDTGNPPKGYAARKGAPINVLWSNPQSMMLEDNAPADLLNPKRGRRAYGK